MATALTVSLATPGLAQSPAVQSGDSIAFMGDSITAGGWNSPVGYVRLVMSALETSGIQAKAIPAGISGHKSNNMRERLQRDVLDKKPTWMTLSCGVNDVWHGANGVPLPQYQTNITAIIDQAQAAGIKVMVLTSTLIGEDPNNSNNQKLAAYNDFLRALAKEKGCLLADPNADMQAGLAAVDEATRKQGNQFTTDGVHMNPQGNMLMASSVLRAFGLTGAQIVKAREAWMSIPNGINLAGRQGVSLKQYEQLKELAAQRKCSVDELVKTAFSETVSNLLKAANP
jgi:lysophospholipase L1-like esterase